LQVVVFDFDGTLVSRNSFIDFRFVIACVAHGGWVLLAQLDLEGAFARGPG